ncbi:pentatricopeptide repeat-containing protein at3g51320 [Phtheirospermum japonicum]|uniref:Pentatricopeptide repeat-containing protein at3g51320 n=1 Tax=Phtheirospermum japonicum TaxID=374723 RepID=A0A830BCA2_9LAMI|nr:pentatricopeptide repeat-containing protein at3g51320 [Phtheirospermum japonicum]
MLRDGYFYPNSFTFPPLISACSKLGRLSLGQMCPGHAPKYEVDQVFSVQNSLVNFYACCGLMDVACIVFDETTTRDLVTWNTIIDGFAKVGEMGLSHKMFDKIPVRNVVSWNVMITRYLDFRNPGNALKLFREMMARRFVSSDTNVVNVIVACGRSNRLKEGKSVHGHLFKTFLSSSLIIDTTMVDM